MPIIYNQIVEIPLYKRSLMYIPIFSVIFDRLTLLSIHIKKLLDLGHIKIK